MNVSFRLGSKFTWYLRGIVAVGILAGVLRGQRIELTETGNEAVNVEMADIQTEVTGRTAVTTFDLVFRNPNNRALEGNLVFPLLEGQRVIRFALDIDGHLREAVPVEKNHGRVVFDQVDRHGAVPALLEQPLGNPYRARIYPIPAQGTRHVRLTYQEDLAPANDQSVYRLALDFPRRLRHFRLHLKVHSLGDSLPEVNTSMDLPLPPWQDEQVMEIERTDFDARGSIELILPKANRLKVMTGRYRDNEYFYAELPNSPILFNRPTPRTVGLLWDSSSSGSERNHLKEFALLDAWFGELKNVEVRLFRLRDHAEPAQIFAVKAGDWRALRAQLEATVYDGATSLDGLIDDPKVDVWTLFSDGLFNYGAKNASPLLPVHGVVHAVLAGTRGDADWLRAVVAKRNGEFIDLLRTDATKAAFTLQTRSARVLAVDFDPTAVSQVFPEVGTPLTADTFIVTGVLKKKNATLRLSVGQDRENAQSIEVPLISGDDPSDIAPRAWAIEKIAQLSIDARANREEIRHTSEAFGIVTANTSLLVLETIDDYLRFDIPPPDELRQEWESRRQTAAADLRKRNDQHLEDVVAKFHERVKWWEHNFPQTTPGAKVPPSAAQVDGRLGAGSAAPRERDELVEPFDSSAPAGESGSAPTLVTRATKSLVFDASAGNAASDASKIQTAATAEIRLTAASPESVYLEHYHRVETDQRYRAYLEERVDHRREPAFYLSSADFFFENGDPQIGLRILSNLAELGTDDPAVLRVLAYRLAQANRPDLAAPIFERVLILRPDEPQSRRDLALIDAELGHFQRAIDLLWEIVDRPWDSRFPEIETIALSELNAIIATCGQKLDVSRIDPRLRRNLPLDLRVVLTWDADGTDIDLWVVDPNRQTAKYDFPLTFQGGQMSRDFTAGYGPEEFDLRQARSGKYVVKINYYGDRRQTVLGPVIAQVKLITDFGTPSQQEKRLTVRLEDKQTTLEVGEMQIGSAIVPKLK